MGNGGTRALDHLGRAGIPHGVHTYEAERSDLSYGEAVAVALGVAPDRLFKTLVARVDDQPVVAIVSVTGQLSLKKLARACEGKRASMAEPFDAERPTGYVTGGISPFGQRRRMPVRVDAGVLTHETVFVSGGRRGIQIELTPPDLLTAAAAETADLADVR